MNNDNKQNFKILPNLDWLFTFMIIFSGYLFLSNPAKTTAQLIFRIALCLLGIAGLMVIKIKKRKR